MNNLEWICNTCKSYLLKNQIPPQADANDLSSPTIPEDLTRLSSLEVRLVCQRDPFMKLLTLPKGKQTGLKGTVVNVPVDHEAVCNTLLLTKTSRYNIIETQEKNKIQRV